MEYAGVSIQFNDEYDNQKQTWNVVICLSNHADKKKNSKKEL